MPRRLARGCRRIHVVTQSVSQTRVAPAGKPRKHWGSQVANGPPSATPRNEKRRTCCGAFFCLAWAGRVRKSRALTGIRNRLVPSVRTIRCDRSSRAMKRAAPCVLGDADSGTVEASLTSFIEPDALPDDRSMEGRSGTRPCLAGEGRVFDWPASQRRSRHAARIRRSAWSGISLNTKGASPCLNERSMMTGPLQPGCP